MGKIEDEKWYAMNAFRGGAISVQSKLNKSKIENFVPMEYGAMIVKGKKVKQQLVAVIPSLIFIKSTFSQIDEICKKTQNLHFRYTKIHGGAKSTPITIPTEEMEQFIAFVGGCEEHIEYLTDPDILDMAKGERVMITEGPFIGRQATFVKIKSMAKRQIVIELESILGARVKCSFPSRIIEKLKV